MNVFYLLFKSFIRLALKIYFKKISLESLENIPSEQPLLISVNHQNAFMDALLAGAFIPAPVYFLTRADVFNRWNRPLMKMLNMMPVYRIRDGYKSLHQNEAIFQTCSNLFAQNKSVLIFSEGNHGEQHYLRPLTKGSARLAIQSQIQMEKSLMILPVGINYFSHRKPGSRVILAFGKTIAVRPYLEQYQENAAQGLIKLRDDIAEGMKATLVIPAESDDYELRKKQVFNSANKSKTFEELRDMETSDANGSEEHSSNHLIAKILNPAPYFILWKILSGVKDPVFHSSLKFSIGLLIFPLWWASVFILFILYNGIFSASIVVTLMITSLLVSYKW